VTTSCEIGKALELNAGGIAGVVTDGRPIRRDQLEWLTAFAGSSPGQRPVRDVDSRVALSCVGVPLVMSPDITATFAGRIDNRQELMSALSDDFRTGDGGKQTLALLSMGYRTWGLRLFEHLLGDFAVCIWDESTRSLVLARDSSGVKSVYYYLDGGQVTWASRLEDLVRLSRAELRIDDDYMIDFLSYVTWPSATPFVGFRQVEPGEVVVIRELKVSRRRFWNLDLKRSLTYTTSEDIADQFAQIFTAAVREGYSMMVH
jgi:asparagine synthetase B (glutamine-hydrolysing)